MPGPFTTWRLQVRVQARAAQTRVVGSRGEVIKVQVHAPPVGGAANAAVVALLADTFGLPRRAVRILRGATARDKLVELDCPDAPACRRRLEAVLEACVDKKKAGG